MCVVWFKHIDRVSHDLLNLRVHIFLCTDGNFSGEDLLQGSTLNSGDLRGPTTSHEARGASRPLPREGSSMRRTSSDASQNYTMHKNLPSRRGSSSALGVDRGHRPSDTDQRHPQHRASQGDRRRSSTGRGPSESAREASVQKPACIRRTSSGGDPHAGGAGSLGNRTLHGSRGDGPGMSNIYNIGDDENAYDSNWYFSFVNQFAAKEFMGSHRLEDYRALMRNAQQVVTHKCKYCLTIRVGGGFIVLGYGKKCKHCGNHIDVSMGHLGEFSAMNIDQTVELETVIEEKMNDLSSRYAAHLLHEEIEKMIEEIARGALQKGPAGPVEDYRATVVDAAAAATAVTNAVGTPSVAVAAVDRGKDTAGTQADTKMLPDDTEVLPGGSKALPNGIKVMPDGTQLMADGTKVLPDGTTVLANGTKVMADGTKFLPNGTKVLPGGSKVLLDGAKVMPDGTQIMADGTKVLPDGTKVLGDGTKILPDGTTIMADGAQILPDGTKVMACKIYIYIYIFGLYIEQKHTPGISIRPIYSTQTC